MTGRLSVLALTSAMVEGLSGCATYNYAENLKMVGFDDNPQKGQSVGNIRGEDCTWKILGYQMGGAPTVDRAFINARNQITGLAAAGLTSKDQSAPSLRYINNVNTANDGFNAGIVAKQCIVVTGVGYR
jgi:hypothetical protein